MEPTFQTTFIPKRSVAPITNQTKPTGLVLLFGFLATVVFIGSIAAYGILFFYKKQLATSIESSQTGLQRQGETFDSNIVLELDDVNRRLQAADILLEKHTVITPLFKSLEDITLKSVRFTNFSLQTPSAEQANTVVKMSGIAQGYDMVALQLDMFSRNRFLKDPIFSNLTPDQKGDINFNLMFTVDPSFVLYKTYSTQ
jgi:hypothetical protein